MHDCASVQLPHAHNLPRAPNAGMRSKHTNSLRDFPCGNDAFNFLPACNRSFEGFCRMQGIEAPEEIMAPFCPQTPKSDEDRAAEANADAGQIDHVEHVGDGGSQSGRTDHRDVEQSSDACAGSPEDLVNRGLLRDAAGSEDHAQDAEGEIRQHGTAHDNNVQRREQDDGEGNGWSDEQTEPAKGKEEEADEEGSKAA